MEWKSNEKFLEGIGKKKSNDQNDEKENKIY